MGRNKYDWLLYFSSIFEIKDMKSIDCLHCLFRFMMQKNYDYILKFVIVGSSSVGKSSILRRFADDEF